MRVILSLELLDTETIGSVERPKALFQLPTGVFSSGVNLRYTRLNHSNHDLQRGCGRFWQRFLKLATSSASQVLFSR
eukprot:4637099-Amphidinium_carterae.1